MGFSLCLTAHIKSFRLLNNALNYLGIVFKSVFYYSLFVYIILDDINFSLKKE